MKVGGSFQPEYIFCSRAVGDNRRHLGRCAAPARTSVTVRPASDQLHGHRARRHRAIPEGLVVHGTDFGKQQRQRTPPCVRILVHQIEQRAGMATSAHIRRGEHRADTEDVDGRAGQRRAKIVAFGAGKKASALDQCDAPQVPQTPVGGHLRAIPLAVIRPCKPFIPNGICPIKDRLEELGVGGDERHGGGGPTMTQLGLFPLPRVQV